MRETLGFDPRVGKIYLLLGEKQKLTILGVRSEIIQIDLISLALGMGLDSETTKGKGGKYTGMFPPLA